ncbi:MAG: membrane protein insertion efficiency factor YidD [Bdellovibrionales bacterium]|nr:membrane protein insertion efficiency factor YidD [Bdellovibrionales bacterium]
MNQANLINSIFINLISSVFWIYKHLISPVIHCFSGSSSGCRFYPSCSKYAEECLKSKKIIPGLLLIFKRLCKCHPGNPGGFDPIP